MASIFYFNLWLYIEGLPFKIEDECAIFTKPFYCPQSVALIIFKFICLGEKPFKYIISIYFVRQLFIAKYFMQVMPQRKHFLWVDFCYLKLLAKTWLAVFCLPEFDNILRELRMPHTFKNGQLRYGTKERLQDRVVSIYLCLRWEYWS